MQLLVFYGGKVNLLWLIKLTARGDMVLVYFNLSSLLIKKMGVIQVHCLKHLPHLDSCSRIQSGGSGELFGY